MADVSAQGVTDWGSLLNSFGQGQQQQRLTGNEVNLTAQQALALSQQNQITQASMPLALQAIQTMTQQQQNDASPNNPDNQDSGASSSTSAASGGGNGIGGMPLTQAQTTMDQVGSAAGAYQTPLADSDVFDQGYLGRVDQAMRAQLTPNTAGTPQEQAAILKYTKQAGDYAGIPGPGGAMAAASALGSLNQAKAARELGVQQRTNNAQLVAGNIFDRMRAVVDAGENGGDALYTLEGVDRAAAARIRNGTTDPAKQQAEAIAYASHMAAESHLYTGRKAIEQSDGTYHDEQTGQLVPGAERVGMSVAQRADLWSKVLEPMDVPDGKGGSTRKSRWAVSIKQGGLGASDPYAAFMGLAAAAGERTASPAFTNSAPAAALRKEGAQQITTAQSDAPPGAPVRNPTGIASFSNRSNAPPPPPGTFAGDVNAPRRLGVDGYPIEPLPEPMPGAKDEDVWPVALRDSNFWVKNAPGVNRDPNNQGNGPGTMTAAQQGNVDAWKKNKQDLTDWSQETSRGSAAAITNFALARDILNGKYDGRPVSSWGATGLPGDFMQWANANLGTGIDSAHKRVEAAKYLAQATESQFGGQFGQAPKSVEALKYNATMATPNLASMDVPTTLNLINSNIAQAAYLGKAARRAPIAVANNVDPGQYGSFYEHYFPRSSTVSSAVAPAMIRVMRPDGKTGSLPASMQNKLPSGWKFAPATP